MKKTFKRQASLGNFTSGKQRRRSSTNSVQLARKRSLTTFTNNNPDQASKNFTNFSTLPTSGENFKKRTSTKTSYVLQSPYKQIDDPVEDDVFAPAEKLGEIPEPEKKPVEEVVKEEMEEASSSDKPLLNDDLHVKI